MVVEDEFHSKPCLTIQYTNGERLEGLGCCELPESVRTHSLWVRKMGLGQEFGISILEPIYQSQPCLTIHHTYNERLDGMS